MFSFFKIELKEGVYVGEELKFENMLIGMYYYNILDKFKGRVINLFYVFFGRCRVVFVINVFGMGINFKDICYVIYYGFFCSIEDFV